MIPRWLEPEVMDTADEARDYDAMDHAAVNGAFVADFLAVWDGQYPILDVGTGTAQIPIALCRQDPRPRVTAIDLAAEMLHIGTENVAKAGLADRITLQLVDAKTMPFAAGSFAAVMSNSIVHHIPEPKIVMADMVRVLRLGGTLFVRDLMRPVDEAVLTRLIETYATGAIEHQRQMFANSLRAALTVEEVRAIVSGLGYEPGNVRQTSDRHWTWSMKKPGASSKRR